MDTKERHNPLLRSTQNFPMVSEMSPKLVSTEPGVRTVEGQHLRSTQVSEFGDWLPYLLNHKGPVRVILAGMLLHSCHLPVWNSSMAPLVSVSSTKRPV